MFEYFLGWKHEAGLLTLAFACLLAFVWIRSFRTVDIVLNGKLMLLSEHGGFTFARTLHCRVSEQIHGISQREWKYTLDTAMMSFKP